MGCTDVRLWGHVAASTRRFTRLGSACTHPAGLHPWPSNSSLSLLLPPLPHQNVQVLPSVRAFGSGMAPLIQFTEPPHELVTQIQKAVEQEAAAVSSAMGLVSMGLRPLVEGALMDAAHSRGAGKQGAAEEDERQLAAHVPGEVAGGQAVEPGGQGAVGTPLLEGGGSSSKKRKGIV